MIKCYKRDSSTRLRAHRGGRECVFEWKKEKSSDAFQLSFKSILRINQHPKSRGIFLGNFAMWYYIAKNKEIRIPKQKMKTNKQTNILERNEQSG